MSKKTKQGKVLPFPLDGETCYVCAIVNDTDRRDKLMEYLEYYGHVSPILSASFEEDSSRQILLFSVTGRPGYIQNHIAALGDVVVCQSNNCYDLGVQLIKQATTNPACELLVIGCFYDGLFASAA